MLRIWRERCIPPDRGIPSPMVRSAGRFPSKGYFGIDVVDPMRTAPRTLRAYARQVPVSVIRL